MTAELLRSQRNQLLELISVAGLDPSDFEFDFDNDNNPVLLHRRSEFYCRFVFDDGDLVIEYEPGFDRPSEDYSADTWKELLPAIRQWLLNLRREYEAPDLWAELQRERELVGDPPAEIENTPFAPDEQRRITAQLAEIRQLVVSKYELTADQARQVEARLKRLEEASHRLGRLDWRELLVGGIVSLALEAIVPTEAVREMLYLAARGLGHLFGADLPELPSG